MNFDADLLSLMAKERIREAEQYTARRRLLRDHRPHSCRAWRVRLGSALIWIGTLVMGPRTA